MIEFVEDVKKILPYDREQYLNFFDDDDSSIDWNGVSVLLGSEGKKNALVEFADAYECLVKNIVLKLDNGSFWIVNHDDKDLAWFPNEENNLTHLRNLFKQREISNAYKGALALTKDDLLSLSKDLILYPSSVFNKESLLYKNLDISHGELPFIIKIYSDFCIDLLSTDKILLEKMVSSYSQHPFIIKKYRGTSF
jgi:hypothetical protein